MAFQHFLKEFNGNKPEGFLLKNLFFSLFFSILVLILFNYFFSLSNENLFFGFIACLSYSFIIPVLNYSKSYSAMSCNCGMMVGMTMGMIASFLPSFIIGATNGMFFGSLFGVLVGIIFGVLSSKSAGVMAVMESLMAAFMGGLMGAMTSTMLRFDHLHLAAGLILLMCVIILFGLKYSIFQEMSKNNYSKNKLFIAILFSLVLTFITLLAIYFGPRGGIF